MKQILSASQIQSAMNLPISVEVLESVDSTNTEAKRRIAAGLSTPLLLLARRQTAGRGRLGRTFCSPEGAGLYMSLVLHPRCSPQNVLALTSAAAVAVATAIEALTPLHPGIKWVNDVYLGNKKVCGILTEGVTNPESGLLNSVVIGIGINCTHAAFPDEVASIATSLEDEGGTVDPNRLAAEVIHRLLAFYDELPHKTWLPPYRERSLLSGKGILWQKGTDRGEGTVLGIGDDGELLLSTASGTLSLTSGEVSVIGWR